MGTLRVGVSESQNWDDARVIGTKMVILVKKRGASRTVIRYVEKLAQAFVEEVFYTGILMRAPHERSFSREQLDNIMEEASKLALKVSVAAKMEEVMTLNALERAINKLLYPGDWRMLEELKRIVEDL